MASTLDAEPKPLHPDADGWPVLPPTLLTVHRTSPEDVRDRQVILSLDGARVGELLFGQTLTVEIAPGPHRLRANNTLVWTTVAFEAQPGTHLHFTCVNRAPAGLYYLLFIFGVAPLFVSLTPGAPPAAGSGQPGGSPSSRA